MSTLLVGERRDGSGSIRKNGEFIEIVESFTYLVKASDKNVDRFEVLTTSGLPIVNITTRSSGAICTSKSCDRSTANPLYWEVKCEFSSARNDQQQDQNNPSDNPVTWIPVWRADIESEDIVAWTDAKGLPYTNSANQKFDEARMKRIPVAVTKFTQYEPKTTTLRTIMDRSNTVNKTAFKTFPKGRLFLIVNSAEYGFYANYECWKVEYTCKYKKGIPGSKYFKRNSSGSWEQATDFSGWKDLRLDVGYYYLSSGTRLACTDDNGNRILGGLDGAGGFVAYNVQPAILGFDEFEEIEFSSFLRTT